MIPRGWLWFFEKKKILQQIIEINILFSYLWEKRFVHERMFVTKKMFVQEIVMRKIYNCNEEIFLARFSCLLVYTQELGPYMKKVILEISVFTHISH